MPQSPPVHYRLDAANRILSVNEAWDAFALRNDGEHLVGAAIVGQSLFDFITDPTTRQLYHTMLDRVRERRSPLMVHFRCDAPGRRREMVLEIRPADDETSVELVARTLHVDDRTTVALIDANAPRDGRILRMCGWCKRVHLPTNAWVEVEEAIAPLGIFAGTTVPQLSHGICEQCETAALRALDGASTEAA